MIDLPGDGSSGRAFDSAAKVMSSSLSLLFPQAKSTWKIRHGLVVVAAASLGLILTATDCDEELFK